MHRASPTLLVLATCLAASLLSSAPARADDSGSTAPSDATPVETADPSPSPFGEPVPFASSAPAAAFATPEPTADELLSVSVAMPAQVGPSTERPSLRPPRARLPLRKGHYGLKVARLQDRLAWLGYPIDPSNTERQAFGKSTAAALRAFQSKNWLSATGRADARTWRALKKMAEPIGVLPLRCTEVTRALCIDKTSRTLRLVVKGKVKLVTDARFGGPGMETGEGVFRVSEKSYNHVSSLYHSWMPRAMFFNGDEAVHYSPDFAAVGYIRGSHGCVGVRDLDVATRLFEKVDVGTRVYVYWS